MYQVKVKPKMEHDGHEGGSVIEVTEAELHAFGDKFVVIEALPESVDMDDVLDSPDENVHLDDSPEKLDITDSALAFAVENDLMVEVQLLSGKGSGKEGRITKKDVEGLV